MAAAAGVYMLHHTISTRQLHPSAGEHAQDAEALDLHWLDTAPRNHHTLQLSIAIQISRYQQYT